jgi:hypothetical protein
MRKMIFDLSDHVTLSLDSAEVWLHRVEWVMWAVYAGSLLP